MPLSNWSAMIVKIDPLGSSPSGPDDPLGGK
jgi:hypothetical protein